MKVPSYAISVAVGVACCMGGIAVGRATAPVKVVEKTKTVTVAVASSTETKTNTASQATREVVRWKMRVITRPGGVKVVEREVEKRDANESRHAQQTQQTQTQIQERIVYRDRVIAAARPNWGLEGRVGLRLDFSKVAGASIQHRLFGPVWGGIWADTTKAAGISLRLEF